MSWIYRLRPKSELGKVVQKYFGSDQRWLNHLDSPAILSQIINSLRPWVWKKKTNNSILPLIQLLEQNQQFRNDFVAYLKKLFENKRIDAFLTDVDIIQDVSFFYELKKRLFDKIIPNQPDVNSVEYVLTQIFYVRSDQKWLKSIPTEEVSRLFELLGLHTEENPRKPVHENEIISQLVYALQVLITRVSGSAFERQVIRMVPEYENYTNPFLAFQGELNEFLENFRNKDFNDYDERDWTQLKILHRQCVEFIDKAYKNSRKFGISMRVNQYLLRIKQQLERLLNILEILVVKDSGKQLLMLSSFVISINYSRYNLIDLLDISTKRVAFEITKHKAKSGGHYITKTAKEYRQMLNASIGGGAIVGVLCIVKLLLSKLDISPFGQAFVYSMNYAIGFIVIYLLGYTLATKQPAMTASSFINSLEKGRAGSGKKMRYEAFAVLFSQLWRSQFISFVGNVFMAFPVALIGVWMLDFIFEADITGQKSTTLLKEIHPFQSKALFHAGIAGIYLFLSGVISGSISNSVNFNRIPFRIKEHPLLKVVLGREKASRIAEFISDKYAGIASNFWFGVFMGSTASVGYFLGLDLDIRHITFASGNMAMGLYGSDWNTTISMVLMVTLGVGLIGFINFAVSFTLSVIVAMRSVDLPLTQLRFLFSSVLVYFLKHPFRFILPINSLEEEEVVNGHS